MLDDHNETQFASGVKRTIASKQKHRAITTALADHDIDTLMQRAETGSYAMDNPDTVTLTPAQIMAKHKHIDVDHSKLEL